MMNQLLKQQLFYDSCKTDSDKADAMNVIGLDYVGNSNIKKAKTSFEQALQLNPNNEYAKKQFKYILQIKITCK